MSSDDAAGLEREVSALEEEVARARTTLQELENRVGSMTAAAELAGDPGQLRADLLERQWRSGAAMGLVGLCAGLWAEAWIVIGLSVFFGK